jgi:hypothetical protein
MKSVAHLIFIFWVGASVHGRGAIKTYDDLSAVQINALQESNTRLDVFDQRLRQLDTELARGKIHSGFYKQRAAELTSLIAEESEFQNAILVQDSKIKVLVQKLSNGIQKMLVATPEFLGVIAMGALKALSGATITP